MTVVETDTNVSDDSEVILSLQDQCFHDDDHMRSCLPVLPVLPNATTSAPNVRRADHARHCMQSAASTGSLQSRDTSLQSFGIIASSFHRENNGQFMTTVVRCGDICSDADEDVRDADETQFIEPCASPMNKTSVEEETPVKQAQAVINSGPTHDISEMTSSLVAVESASRQEMPRALPVSPVSRPASFGCDIVMGCELDVASIDHQFVPDYMTRSESPVDVNSHSAIARRSTRMIDQAQSFTSSERCSLSEIPCSPTVQNLPATSACIPGLIAAQVRMQSNLY